METQKSAPSASLHRPSHTPGEGLLSPLPLLGIALLLLNDHLLKYWRPGLITGKLSDFAGLLFFPLLLQAFVELFQKLLRCSFTPSQRVLLVCACLSSFVFVLIKLTDVGGVLYTRGLYLLQWPLLSLSHGELLPLTGQVSLVQDPADLIALPMAFVSLWVGKKRSHPKRTA